MIVRRELAQRRIDFRRHQQAEQARLQGQGRPPHIQKSKIGQADIHRHARHAQRGEELQHRGRQERNAQHRHRALTQRIAGGHDGCGFGLRAAIELQGGEPAQPVGEESRQAGEGAQVAAAGALRAPPHQGHEQRNQRRRDQQHQAGDHVDRKQHDRKRDRQHRGRGHRGQVLGEEAIQRLHLIHHRAGQLARSLTPAPVGALHQQPLEQGLAHMALDAFGRVRARTLARPADAGAQQHQPGDAEDAAQQFLPRRLPGDRRIQHAGQQPGLHDQQGAAEQGRGSRHDQRKTRAPGKRHQPPRLFARRFLQGCRGIVLEAACAAAHSSSRLARGSWL
ncbi:hypothetical protein D3C72_1338920 [compost metagenome]